MPRQSDRGASFEILRLAETRPGFVIAAASAAYLAGSIAGASKRPFFFDEIMTVWLGQLPDLSAIWQAIAKGIELNPPGTFWLAWLLEHAVGHGEVVSRLPAIAGFWLMCFCLYRMVSRRCGPAFGLIAFLLPIFSYVNAESAVARGYGVMLGCAALGLLSWQLACDGVRRGLALCGIAIGVAGAVSSHYYATYLAAAIAVGEVVRSVERRKIDVPIWAALAAGVSPLAAFAPLLKAASAGASKNFWISPLPRFLYESYGDLLGALTIPLFLFLFLLMRRHKAEPEATLWQKSVVPAWEATAIAVLAAMPLAVYVAALFGAAPFFSRYVMLSVLGSTLLVSHFAYRLGGGSERFRRIAVCFLATLCLIPWTAVQGFKLAVMASPAQQILSRAKLPLEAGLPVLFDGELDFLEYWYYSDPATQSRLYFPLNRAAAVKYRGADTSLRSLAVASTFRELHAVDYDRFLAEHREFMVVRMREEGWVVQSLMADGAQVRLMSLDKKPGYFVDTAYVYRVTMPER